MTPGVETGGGRQAGMAMAVAMAVALVSGLLFGIGLLASGMTDPGKVQAFLDVAGAWDPSLAFVMGGAMAVAAIGFALAARRGRTWSGGVAQLPDTRRIDARLVAGGLLFGAGWGLAGFCPGPALVVLAGGGEGWLQALAFTAAMLVGMLGHDAVAGGFAAGAARGASGRKVPPAAAPHR